MNLLFDDMLILKNKIKFITATSLFDGHDASINIIRRLLQNFGAEVIHLGHNRSVKDIVHAAIAEDVQGIAISSYQGGHIEYFLYILSLLKKYNASHIQVFGGGGGVITLSEIRLLHRNGICKIFAPMDGQTIGLEGIVVQMLRICDFNTILTPIRSICRSFSFANMLNIAQHITLLELDLYDKKFKYKRYMNSLKNKLNYDNKIINFNNQIVLGITGSGGSGKSSLIDELLLRFGNYFSNKKIAILSVDPTRKRTGGALLGDRIRMNNANNKNFFIRSIATRTSALPISMIIADVIKCLNIVDFDLIILETVGIGQDDNTVVKLCDFSIYVMTSEFGAPSQLEKINMLDDANFVVINKFDKFGSLDALFHVKKIYQRNNNLNHIDYKKMPVFGTIASEFNNHGVNLLFKSIISHFKYKFNNWLCNKHIHDGISKSLAPKLKIGYLNKVSKTINIYHKHVYKQQLVANKAYNYFMILEDYKCEDSSKNSILKLLQYKYENTISKLDLKLIKALKTFDNIINNLRNDMSIYYVRNKKLCINNFNISLSKNRIPKIALPSFSCWGDKIKFLLLENFPGYFPFTSGVFSFKRQNEDPTRMFAGEGIAERTNKRFHLLTSKQSFIRLSTAFDSPTLYGADPAVTPDIYGKIGNSGVSICSLDDMKRLYSGFNLCDKFTSVSMTINGPAPIILAYFFNTAIDSQCELYLKRNGLWQENKNKIKDWFKRRNIPCVKYRLLNLPNGHNKLGLGFLGISADLIISKSIYNNIKKTVLKSIRGTVQADILKEDQAQNTCIFSSSFAIKMMGDMQEYFIKENINNFYSVSLSGYHIAEAGANPITQLAFTLANAFTIVEYYISRGMHVDDFMSNLSFFFSNGLDVEYSVIGRVARRIWSIAICNIYKGNLRSQKLKYHIQTSGRSLHAQEIDFNDIRTTLQALYAIADNCNSLHTNAYDEALTTPTEESVKRALAIQLIINKEFGYIKNENFLQGSFFIEYMTDLVERQVLKEFKCIDDRGGVLGAMETMYQRNKIQEESLFYEHQKDNGIIPIIGVNTFINIKRSININNNESTLVRSTKEEKDLQVQQISFLNKYFLKEKQEAINNLKIAVQNNENIFDELMYTTKRCTIGDISNSLYEVGGSYRRNM